MILNRRMVREGNAVGESGCATPHATFRCRHAQSRSVVTRSHVTLAGRGGSEDKKGYRNGEPSHWRDLQGDYGNIALLLLLYTLQGVPMGLGASIPLLLQVSPHPLFST
jgi:hypothetical protein